MNKATATEIYNTLVKYHILLGATIRQANIQAVKDTWYFYNNQHLLGVK